MILRNMLESHIIKGKRVMSEQVNGRQRSTQIQWDLYQNVLICSLAGGGFSPFSLGSSAK